MADFENRGEGAKAEEDRYFYELEQRRLKDLHQNALMKAARGEMAEVLGLRQEDEDILIELQQLGYAPDTVNLLPIVPLVQVAWSEGDVKQKEREAVLEVARSRGVTPESPAWATLQQWLDARPGEGLFEGSLDVLRKIVRAGGASHVALGELVADCTRVAAAAGGFLGFGHKISEVERSLIDKIASELGQPG